MREARLIEVTELDPEAVAVENRLRPISESGVQSVMASVEALQLLKDEIIVRQVRHQGGRLILVAGAHRLEACRRMGRKVPAKIYDCSDDWARMMELDDNLAGAELGALDSAVFLAERKRLFEKLHPEMAQGGFRGNQHTGNLVPDIVSFTTSTAEKFGLSERQIHRLVAAGSNLLPEEIALLRKACKPVTLKDLSEISKASDPQERGYIAKLLMSGHAKNAADARRKYAAEINGDKPKVKDPVEGAFKWLLTAWKRAPKEACRRFVEEAGPDLYEMVQDLFCDGGDNE
ncbi:ParB/RepB/Spo0J family partition protein [Profundibacter sp.]